MLRLQTLKDPKRQKVYAKKYENSKVARFLRAKLAITRYRHLSQMRAGLFWHLYHQSWYPLASIQLFRESPSTA